MVWPTNVTLNVCVTVGLAAFQSALPAWLAVIEQVPTESRVTEEPATVQTAREFEAKVTVRPELAVAEMATGESTIVWLANAPKVIVWFPLAMVKLRLTWGAAVIEW